MEKIFIVGPNRLAPEILFMLQQAGVMQVDSLPRDQLGAYQLDRETETRFRRWEAVATLTDHTSGLLGLEFDAAVEPFLGDLEEAEATASSCEQRAASLVEKRERLRDELQLIDQYQEVLEYLAAAVQGLDGSSRLAVIPFLAERPEDLAESAQELTSALDNRFLLAEGAVGNLIAAVIITLKRDAEAARGILAHAGLHELPRLGEYARMDLRTMAARLTARSRLAPYELTAVEEELRHLRQEAGQELNSIWNQATDEANRLHTLRAMASGRYGFALFGWMPVSRKTRVIELLNQLGDRVLYTFEPAEEHHEPARIPVLLENPEWVRPFEALISFLNTPRYDSWDPTWITATLFPLWFGMIVGDVGYGLVFAGIAWYLSTFVRHNQALRLDFFKLRLSPPAVTQLVRIMKPLIVWTILWGLVYGECFGNLFHRLGVFGTLRHPGLIPTLIHRTDTAATATLLIVVSIGFGIIQVLHGFVLKAQLSRRHGERKPFWEAAGYFGGVLALVLFGYAFMTGGYPRWLLVAMFAGAALFVAGMLLAQMPLMIAELPTQGGHILSYIRIYAVGLASAILADLATDIGFGFFQMWGIAGVVVGVLAGLLVGLLIHALLLVFLTISHVLQPIRLIWVEFFTKFDFYTLSGRPYRPFKLQGGEP
ncbi:MAG: V-type ATP synthase subunit I [Desulfobaccales bacterium]